MSAVFQEEYSSQVIFEDTLPNYISNIVWLRIDILLTSITKCQNYFDRFVLSLNIDNPFLKLINKLLILIYLFEVDVYDDDIGKMKRRLDSFFDWLSCNIDISSILSKIQVYLATRKYTTIIFFKQLTTATNELCTIYEVIQKASFANLLSCSVR